MRGLARLGALLLLLVAMPLRAEGPSGSYDGSQTELAAWLELDADGRFSYWVSYGAVDEVSQGSWHQVEGGIVLDSDPVTAPEFEQVRTSEGEPDALAIHLEVPTGLPVQLFSANVTMADGTAFVADFNADELVVPLDEGGQVATIALALPIFEVRSADIPVEDGAHDLSFRFEPNDLGVFDFDEAFLPERDGAYLLERFDRLLRFRKIEL
ncbi:hypothetical protein [Erythrobacter mangrovi]|uniref:Uncharacterized protein n=1 Tax=Erythrobacter mangrovi TaxID=2739433 RepID=A0A7D4BAM1_9SPHN|nr:hypothetical protein [Erythrobacter mangrovi]QKG71741.1 hypothetical protein HQR01_10415 [Erythrobacter mangrovi]